MPPDVRDWLPADHLAWFVIDAVAEMDLGEFYAAYRTDGHGRAAYEPSVMVALILSKAEAMGRSGECSLAGIATAGASVDSPRTAGEINGRRVRGAVAAWANRRVFGTYRPSDPG